MAKKESRTVVEVVARFDKETKRKKRYGIVENEYGIVGTIYTDKDKEVPDEVMLTFED